MESRAVAAGGEGAGVAIKAQSGGDGCSRS